MKYSIERAADLIFGDKHPNYKKNFIKTHLYSQYSINERDFEYAKKVYNTFFKHQKLFKDNNLNPFNVYNIEYNYGNYDYEKFEDDMISIINQNKAKKLGKSVLRGYYNRLKNEETDKLLLSLIINDINKEDLQKGISKVAAFKNTEDLNNSIRKVLSQNGYTKEKLIKEVIEYNEKINNTNIPLYEIDYVVKDDFVILNISDYESSEIFGSPQWCISYDQSLFNEYYNTTPDGVEQIHGKGNTLFFIYDFSKEQDDPMFKISPLFSTNGTLIECFNQYDDEIETEFLKQFFNKAIIYEFLEKATKNKEDPASKFDEFEYFYSYLKNESNDPIIELLEAIEEFGEDFFDELPHAGIFMTEQNKNVREWLSSPYGHYIVNKYPEKYLNACLKIEYEFIEKLINPDEKNSLFFQVLYQIENEKDIKLDEKMCVAYTPPLIPYKNNITLYETAINILPIHTSGVSAFVKIADSLTREQITNNNREEKENVLIKKCKEFFKHEETKYDMIKSVIHHEFMNSNFYFKNLRKAIESEISTISKNKDYNKELIPKIEPSDALQAINIMYKNSDEYFKDIIAQGLEKFNENNSYDKEKIEQTINQIKIKNKTKKMRP